MSQSSKHIALWLVLLLVLLGIFSVFSKQAGRDPEVVFSEFLLAVERGEVQEVVIQGHNIQGKYKNGERFRTFAPDDPELVKSLREKKVKIAAKPEDDSPWYYVLLINWFPMLLLIGVWVFFMRQMQVGGGKAMSFGKSRAKLLTENQHRVTFSDVAGAEEAKDDLQEIIAFLKDPKNSPDWAAAFPRVACLSALRAPVRHCWRGRSPAKRACRFLASAARTSLKCSSVSAPHEYAICLCKVRKTRLVSSSSMKSTRWDGIVAPGSVAVMMNASKPSISYWWKWTASKPMKALS